MTICCVECTVVPKFHDDRIRVQIQVDVPLKKKKKLDIHGGLICYLSFKYKDLPTFCFICGVLGHSEKFCERLFHILKDQIVKSYGLELKALPRRRHYANGSKWPKSGVAMRPGSSTDGGESSNHGGQSSPLMPAGDDGPRIVIPHNQESRVQPGNLDNNTGGLHGENLMSRIKVNSLQIGVVNEAEKSLAPNVRYSNDGLLFLDLKRRRMAFDNQTGLIREDEVYVGFTVHNNKVYSDIETSHENALLGDDIFQINLNGAGSGSQARQEL
uniref:Zinc knuckle CX2CX4HX4C domain-containing protein n=1 Tax=Cannabis sativa TaxID=3483 RepID=A0A803QQT1_CANSA